jgi:hypothetical protein
MPHLEVILPHTRGEIQTISPHTHIPNANRKTTCTITVERNGPNFAPREKEKILVRQNSAAWISSRPPAKDRRQQRG